MLLAKAGVSYRLNIWYDQKLLLRRKAILHLKKGGKYLQTDVALSDYHLAHSHPQKQDYLNSLAQNPYILCVAGWGNYSYRFYETLREGRIPVFIDTECLLPCTDIIDWKSLIVWVPERKTNYIARTITSFHNNILPAVFKERQEILRNIYEQYLTKKGFAEYLFDWFGKRVPTVGEIT